MNNNQNSKKLFGVFILFLLLLSLPVTVLLSQQKQDLRQKAQTVSYPNIYGMQADMASAGKVPNASQFQTLNPAWLRFVYKPAFPMPVIPANVNQLIVFNNESAEPAPIGSQDINQWKSYTDSTYIPKLKVFLAGYPNTSAIEIWNEEDICPGPSFCPGVPAGAYAYMLKQASSVVKTTNANIKVVMGGLASGNLNYVTDVKNADSNVFSNVDGLGLHPYGKSPNGWCANGTDPGCNGNALPFGDLATSINDYYNTSALPVWVTEIGQGTDDTNWQAEYLQRVFNVLKPPLQVPMVNWYAFIDTMLGGNGSSNWGLYDSNNNIKPSGVAFSSFTTECGGIDQPPCCDPNQLTMSALPNPATVGQPITFNLSGTQGSTYVADTFPATVSCPGFPITWPTQQTCITTATGTDLSWTHTWRNCAPNNCGIYYPPSGSPACSKNLNFTINPLPTPTLTPTPTPYIDTVPPSVIILQPLSGSYVAKNTTVVIAVYNSDNIAVTKTQLYINNTLKYTGTAPSYSYSWLVPAKPRVTYTITAKAYDAAGNSGFQTIKVTSK